MFFSKIAFYKLSKTRCIYNTFFRFLKYLLGTELWRATVPELEFFTSFFQNFRFSIEITLTTALTASNATGSPRDLGMTSGTLRRFVRSGSVGCEDWRL
jgi:hypothetical protein